MLLTGALVWTLSSSAASARTVQAPKDDRYLRAVITATGEGIASLDGTRFEVNEFGVDFAAYILQSGDFTSVMIRQAKGICRELNAAAKRGPKAVRTRSAAIGEKIGRDDLESLQEVDANPELSDDDKFSVGVVVGLISTASFKAGLQSYCPRHNKQARVMTQAWNSALGS